MSVHGLPAAATVVVSLALAACATTVTVIGEPGVVGDPGPAAPFPECQVAEFAFVGETSLAAIGLGRLAGGPDVNRIGQVWVTAGPGNMDPGVGGAGNDRVLCIEWPDGSGMSTTIEDGWQPPGAGVVETAAAPAWPVIGAVVALAVLLGASAIAFRRE